jgi:BNR repeat-like domain/Carbohydrate esterase, sialic acid-specific acetylesterase
MKGLWIALLAAFWGTACPTNAAEPVPPGLHAWYRSDGLKMSGAAVDGWENSAKGATPEAAARRHLIRVVGQPRAFRVATADGERTVLRLDGNSALWQAAGDWGSLAAGRTVILFARLARDTEGFVFDGSTNTGLTRAQVRAGKWQIGVQPPPISNAAHADATTHRAEYGEWQVHGFVLEKQDSSTRATHFIDDAKEWRSIEIESQGAAPLSGLIVGANAATKLGIKTDLAELLVFDRALSLAEQQQVAKDLRTQWGQPADLPADKQPKEFDFAEDPRVFRQVLRKPGDDGSQAYRIPGLATTPKGTLLAVFDIRYSGGADLPADIDVGLMRSTDDGATWSPMQRILDFDKAEPNSRGNGVGDPTILVDRQTGTVWVAALWSKGNRGWNGSGPGLTPEETGQFVLTKSSDDGVTWSPPINITKHIKDPQWKLCFQGPGAGIQTTDGTLIFPAQFRDASGTAHSCFIFSRDHGSTWTISPAAIPGKRPTSEAQIAELDDGSLLLTMRDESRSGQRAWAQWTWNTPNDAKPQGKWSEPWFTVPDPTCMASLIRHPHGELLFANPNSATQRVALTIRTSHDCGRSWSDGQLLDSRGCMYSCLTVLKDGRIGILYEVGGTLTFARFPLDWVTPDRKLSLALPFTDHMILQRDISTPVWGRAPPGANVAVSFAGQNQTTRANERGDWLLKLDPLPVSVEPRELRVSADKEQLVCRDVLVGEVWVCAGQSNMEWPLEKEAHAAETLLTATHPNLRLLNLSFAGQYFFGKPFGAAEVARQTALGFYRGEWQRSSPESAKSFSAVGYYFGHELLGKLPSDTPIGLIHLAVGGSPAEAWIRREAIAAEPPLQPMLSGNWLDNAELEEWCRQRGHQNLDAALKEGSSVPGDDLGSNHPFKPTFLWEAGIARLIPFGIRGAIWYQGESNSLSLRRVEQHERLFPLLVRDWRKQWGLGDFPFLYCQLSGIGTEGGYKSQHWPEFRDSQRRMLAAIPNTGMAVTSDLGHPNDVHPRNKRDVGQRLARWALAKSYQQPLEFSGPTPVSALSHDARLVVEFDHAEGLASSDGQAACGFDVAGSTGEFLPATAEIIGTTITLMSPRVPSPVRVRYAWQPFPNANLVNAAKLPASTFELSVTRKP